MRGIFAMSYSMYFYRFRILIEKFFYWRRKVLDNNKYYDFSLHHRYFVMILKPWVVPTNTGSATAFQQLNLNLTWTSIILSMQLDNPDHFFTLRLYLRQIRKKFWGLNWWDNEKMGIFNKIPKFRTSNNIVTFLPQILFRYCKSKSVITKCQRKLILELKFD